MTKTLLASTCSVVLLLSSCLNQQQDSTLHGVVTRVSDGDTVTLTVRGGNIHRVRLTGIDAPEKKQAYGKHATEALRDLVYQRQVSVAVDGTDRYQRMLGTIEVSGKNVNEAMVEQGFAWHYKQYNDDPTLSKLEQHARRNQLGLWQGSSAIAPWDYREQQRDKRKKAATSER